VAAFSNFCSLKINSMICFQTEWWMCHSTTHWTCSQQK